MVTAEEFILQHADVPYDPVKAHEYYLRTRQLKGREPGKGDQPDPKIPKLTTKDVRYIRAVTNNQKKAEQQRKEVEARVEQLKAKLNRLHAILRKLVNEAQGRTVVDSKGKPVNGKAPAKKATAGSKRLTTAQKREAAKRSKDYYKKHRKELTLDDQQKQLQQQIKEVEIKIAKARQRLKASVVNARRQVQTNRQ